MAESRAAVYGAIAATYTVIAEDVAALIRLAIAAAGIASSHYFNMPQLDGVASILIAILLAGIALVLIQESKGLLIGEGIRPETARTIRAMALRQPSIRSVGRILSMYVGPDNVLATIDVDFHDDTAMDDAATAIAEVEEEVRRAYPMIRKLFIETGVNDSKQRWSRPDARQPPKSMMN